MSELIAEIQRRRTEFENTELVSKLPPESLREADLVLGILFNGCVHRDVEFRLQRSVRPLQGFSII